MGMCMNQMLRPLAATNYGLSWVCVTHGGSSVSVGGAAAALRRRQRRPTAYILDIITIQLQPSMQVHDSLQMAEYSLPACKWPTGQQPTFWTLLAYSCTKILTVVSRKIAIYLSYRLTHP